MYEKTNDPKYKTLMEKEKKALNFTPTYDNRCLTCDKKGVKLRCGKCKVIYFCNEECQKEAWTVHKKHCGRDLFCVCIYCGKSVDQDNSLKCARCYVRFCSDNCYRNIINLHIDFDCDKFRELFG